MSMTHHDQAIAEEFTHMAEAIHPLKTLDLGFRALLEQGHDLWKQIWQILKGITPAGDAVLEVLEKRPLDP